MNNPVNEIQNNYSSEDTYQLTRDILKAWQADLTKNVFTTDVDFKHTINFYFGHDTDIVSALTLFGLDVSTLLEDLVKENNKEINLPQLTAYNAIGERIDAILHHPSYVAAGEIIYRTGLLTHLAKPGGLLPCLSLLFLSAQAGEAGHNCPIACSAGIIRVLQRSADFPERDTYLNKLMTPSYINSFTGAQFLTEIQGGSDVSLNACYAVKKNNHWQIFGEKWFCSNAGADLIFITARFDPKQTGTKGLGLFLVPAKWQNQKNFYQIKRLKDKLGTRSMATGEIEFNGAYAIAIGLADGFQIVMNHVLHLSRLFNSVCVLGMARRAFNIAQLYARHRVAFSKPIIEFPLIQENLAKIKAENAASLAGIFATIHLQDALDKTQQTPDEKSDDKLLLRLLVNIQKYWSAKTSVEHIHHALDVLAGNGTIETFSSIPRLLRDCLICENWEGTHNVLHAQVHKDILKYAIDKLYLQFLQERISDIDDSEQRKTWQQLCLMVLLKQQVRL